MEVTNALDTNSFILELRRFMARQGSTNIIKMLYVITYTYQNFGIPGIHGQIPKSIYQASYLSATNFPNNFSYALSSFYLNRKRDC